MPTLAWQKLELFKGILREPSLDGNRLIIWIPEAIEGKAQSWERVSNIAGAEISEDRGVYSTAVPGRGLERHRHRCRGDRSLPGQAADDVDLSSHQSCPAHPLARDRKG